MANVAKSVTLAASTVQSVTLNEARGSIRLEMRSTSPVDTFITVGDNGQTPTPPTVGGDDCYCLPGVAGEQLEIEVGQQPVVVSLISSGTPSITVESDHPNRH